MIDLLLTNARVYTVDPAQPWAEAVACRDGRIVAVGRAADLDALAGPTTRRIDCGGRPPVPRLTDPPLHTPAHALPPPPVRPPRPNQPATRRRRARPARGPPAAARGGSTPPPPPRQRGLLAPRGGCGRR